VFNVDSAVLLTGYSGEAFVENMFCFPLTSPFHSQSIPWI